MLLGRLTLLNRSSSMGFGLPHELSVMEGPKVPKQYRLWPVALGYPPELDKTLVLKSPFTLVAGHREAMLGLSSKLPLLTSFHSARRSCVGF